MGKEFIDISGAGYNRTRIHVYVGQKVCLKERIPRSKLLGSSWDNTPVQASVEIAEIIDRDTVRVMFPHSGICLEVKLSEIDFDCR